MTSLIKIMNLWIFLLTEFGLKLNVRVNWKISYILDFISKSSGAWAICRWAKCSSLPWVEIWDNFQMVVLFWLVISHWIFTLFTLYNICLIISLMMMFIFVWWRVLDFIINPVILIGRLFTSEMTHGCTSWTINFSLYFSPSWTTAFSFLA